VLALALFAAVASVAHAEEAKSPVDIQVSEGPDRIVLQYALGDYQTRTVNIGGEDFQELRLAGEAVTMEPGAPRLPKVCRSLIIPDDAQMALRILAADCEQVSASILPSKGNLPRSTDPRDVPYTFGDAYRADAFYPGELARLGTPYILRDYRGVVVELYPFQYNPVTGVLRVYKNITLEVARTGPGKINVLERNASERRPSRAFHQLYKHHFVNYGSKLRYPPLDEDGDMLIIVHDPWIPYVEPLAAHKNSIGINTTVVGVSTIGNNAEAIHNYIQSVYDTSDLAFVLLVGDIQQVATPYDPGAPSDPTYAKLAGGDDYPDVMVGRFSAQSPLHVDTQVQRTIEYEVNQATQQEWFWRGAGIGSEPGHLDSIRDELLAHGYTHVDQIYDPDATPEMIAAALNEGRGIVNYIGHGSSSFWGTGSFFISDIDELVNADMLPFIFSVASCNGNFAVDECFAEAWLRAEQGGVPTGAIATYMASDYQYWDGPPVAQQEFVDLYVNEAYVSFGTLCFAGACRMIDEYGPTGAMMFDTWIVFGDPSLRVVGTVFDPSVRYVDDDAPLGGNGLSWETAYKYLQDALYEATANPHIAEIRVAGGVYKPDQDEAGNVTSGDREATFQLLNGVGLYGGYRGIDPNNPGDPDDRDPSAFESILSGDLAGNDEPDFVNNDENSYHVVTGSGTDATALIDGVTIAAGNAEEPPGADCCHEHAYPGCGDPNCELDVCSLEPNCCSIEWNDWCAELASDLCDVCLVAGKGGGMYNGEGNPTIIGCTFRGNSALRGGGMYNVNSNPTVTNCTFSANAATDENPEDLWVGGGGMCNFASSPTLVNCTFTGNFAYFFGGGILCTDNSAPTIRNCLVAENTSEAWWVGGGGIACVNHSSATIIDCTVTTNTAGNGGGICCREFSSPAIANCLITDNSAGDGGGIFCYRYCRPVIVGCTITGNTADDIGGGVYCHMSSSAKIVSCTISGNSASDRAGGIGCLSGSSVMITNCLINGNLASGRGGGLYCYANSLYPNSPMIVNCTVSGNSAGDRGGGIGCYWNTSPTIANCVFWANAAPLGAEIELSSSDYPSGLTVSYSDVEGGELAACVEEGCTLNWGPGNIDADPLFVDPDGPDNDPNTWEDNDYRLSPGSPCIDAGCNCGVARDSADLDGDGDTDEITPFDLDGEGRFFDDPDTPDSGSGWPPIVDMGAYEFGGSGPQPCIGDLDNDRDVDLSDLAALLSHYGMTSGAGVAEGDLDCDGAVGLADLAALLAVYGTTCP